MAENKHWNDMTSSFSGLCLDLGKYSTGSFLDIAKPFDSPDRIILLEKLEHYGVSHNAMKWFKSSFFTRLQYVEYN